MNNFETYYDKNKKKFEKEFGGQSKIDFTHFVKNKHIEYLEMRLEKAEKYMQHKHDCEVNEKLSLLHGFIRSDKCTCGFDDYFKDK